MNASFFDFQRLDFSCGPACLRMLLRARGTEVTEEELVMQCLADPHAGTDARRMSQVLRRHGIGSRLSRRLTKRDLLGFSRDGTHVILNYREPGEEVGHYALLAHAADEGVTLMDPTHGPDFFLPWKEFLPRWYGHRSPLKDRGRGIILS